jgi:membrane protein DedA with SNARE-associated domain
MNLDEFLRQYGLLAVYLGMWLEGETVMVIGGFLAHQDYFSLAALYPVVFLGALSVDHAVYLAGRLSGRLAIIKRFHGESEGPSSWKRHLGENWPVFLMVRFIYGTRTPYLFYVGTRRMSWLRFLGRELVAVALWCFVWVFFGQLFGHLLFITFGRLHHPARVWIIAAMAVTGIAAVGSLALRRRRRIRRAAKLAAADRR